MQKCNRCAITLFYGQTSVGGNQPATCSQLGRFAAGPPAHGSLTRLDVVLSSAVKKRFLLLLAICVRAARFHFDYFATDMTSEERYHLQQKIEAENRDEGSSHSRDVARDVQVRKDY